MSDRIETWHGGSLCISDDLINLREESIKNKMGDRGNIYKNWHGGT